MAAFPVVAKKTTDFVGGFDFKVYFPFNLL